MNCLGVGILFSKVVESPLECKDSTHVCDLYAFELPRQTDLPPNQPTGLKEKNMHDFDIFQPIWLRLGMESLN